jgi:8-oxo-dGTP pyrophosphatase MutT (NUDIX family)
VVDIRLPLGEGKFSVRVGLICVRDGALLVNRLAGDDFGFVPGGALGTGEDILACAQREWREETGLEAAGFRFVGIVENYFNERGTFQHEIGCYVVVDPPAEAILPDVVVDSADTAFVWVPLDEVRSYPVLPAPVADLLDVPLGQLRHLVNREVAWPATSTAPVVRSSSWVRSPGIGGDGGIWDRPPGPVTSSFGLSTRWRGPRA